MKKGVVLLLIIVGEIVLIYNFFGVKELKFFCDVYLLIFIGEVI